MYPIRHGGGPSGLVTVTDSAAIVIQPNDKNRKYLEIQNNSDAAYGNSGRVYLSISDSIDAVALSGLYLVPGAVYTMTVDNLSPARVTAIAASGESSDISWQVGR
jgi:hypothetical protein